MTRFLITGATGLLGPWLVEAAARAGEVVTAGFGRSADERTDLRDGTAVQEMLARVRPDVVVHAAALTDVDRCEREPAEAARMNELAVANVARALGVDSRLVLVSTDQVYPDTAGPHVEGSEAPVNAYGRSKLAGERAAFVHVNSLAVRTNLFGPSRTPGRISLSDFFTSALAAGERVRLFRDSLFSPLHVRTLGNLLVRLALGSHVGVLNLGSRQGMSKADFALALASQLHLPTRSAEVTDSTTLVGRAPRPHDLRLDVRRAEAALGIALPTLSMEIEKL